MLRWAKSWNVSQGTRLIDTSVFQAGQPHYTADPLLGSGVTDPVGKRWHLVRGSRPRASLVIPPEDALGASRPGTSSSAHFGGHGGGGFDYWLGQIGGIEHGFFIAIGGAVGRGIADRMATDRIIEAVRTTILAADPGHRSKATIQRYADRGYLARTVKSLTRADAAQDRDSEAAWRRIFTFPSGGTQTRA